jgi:ribonucleoside-diphosphate reductase alpha chain
MQAILTQVIRSGPIVTIDRSFLTLNASRVEPEAARAAGLDCPSVFAPISWSLDSVHGFAAIAQLGEGASISDRLSQIAQQLAQHAQDSGTLPDAEARDALGLALFDSLINRRVGVSAALCVQLGFTQEAEIARPIRTVSHKDARSFISDRKQAQFDAAALAAGRENLRSALERVGEAVARAKGQGHDDPRDNPVLATAVSAAFRAGAPAGAVAEAIDDARHGYFNGSSQGGYIDSPILEPARIMLVPDGPMDGDLLLEAARTGCQFGFTDVVNQDPLISFRLSAFAGEDGMDQLSQTAALWRIALDGLADGLQR